MRDLRGTPLWREVDSFLSDVLAPASGLFTYVEAPAPSPDGRRVAFVGYTYDSEQEAERGRICVVDLEDDSFQQLTHGPASDEGPRWSPDGSRLSFRSDRSGGVWQLFEFDENLSGEPRTLGRVDGSVEHHEWSPDGSMILAVAAGPKADIAGAAGSGSVGGPKDLDWLPIVDSYRDRDLEFRRAWLVDPSSGDVTPVSDLNVWEATWSGRSIVAVVSDEPGEDAWYTAHLVSINPRSGLTQDVFRSDVQIGCVQASADGRWVAFVEALCSDRLGLAGDLVMVDMATSRSVRMDTGSVDVTSLHAHPTGRLVGFGLRGLDTVAGEVTELHGEWKELWSTKRASGRFRPAGCAWGTDGLICVVHSASEPPHLVAVSDTERRVADASHPGTDVAKRAIKTRKRIAWKGLDDQEIEGLLTLPHGSGPFPLIVHIHGGPVWAYQDRWYPMTALFASRGFAVLEPNPRGSSGRGQAFARMIIGDMGGADAADVIAGVDKVVEKNLADWDRVGLIGRSYGGFMACWLPVLDQRFKAAVALAPTSDFYSQHFGSNIGQFDVDFLQDRPETPGGEHHRRSPVFMADKIQTPTLLVAGLEDRCTPPGQAIEQYRALRAHDVPTEAVLYPGEGHHVRQFRHQVDMLTRSVAWFESFLDPA